MQCPQWLRSGRKGERGSTLTGYSLVVALVAVVSLSSIAALNDNSETFLTNTGSKIGEPRPSTADLIQNSVSTPGPPGPGPGPGPAATAPATPGGITSTNTFTYGPEGIFTRTNGSLCLEAGNPVTQEVCDGNEANQKVRVYEEQDTGFGYLKIVIGDKCVGTVSGVGSPNWNVRTRTCSDLDLSQWWQYDATTQQFINDSGRCLDVSGGSNSAGGQLIHWGCHSNDNQKFLHPGLP